MTTDEKLERPQLRVKDVMTRNPTVVPPEATVQQIRQVMRQLECRHIPVVHNGHLVGMVSTRDFERKGETASEIMSEQVEISTPDMKVEDAAAAMAYLRVNSLPVMDNDDLVGIVTSYDILAAFVGMIRGTLE